MWAFTPPAASSLVQACTKDNNNEGWYIHDSKAEEVAEDLGKREGSEHDESEDGWGEPHPHDAAYINAYHVNAQH